MGNIDSFPLLELLLPLFPSCEATLALGRGQLLQKDISQVMKKPDHPLSHQSVLKVIQMKQKKLGVLVSLVSREGEPIDSSLTVLFHLLAGMVFLREMMGCHTLPGWLAISSATCERTIDSSVSEKKSVAISPFRISEKRLVPKATYPHLILLFVFALPVKIFYISTGFLEIDML